MRAIEQREVKMSPEEWEHLEQWETEVTVNSPDAALVNALVARMELAESVIDLPLPRKNDQ